MTGAETDIFISYKAEDRSRVRLLVAALEAEGFSVWWDAHIGSGINWRRDIEEHLDSAKSVVVAWSKRSIAPDGEFVRDEATRARKRGVYLPVRLDAVDPPLGFGEVQALSLKGWKGDRADPRFQALADAVRGYLSGEHVSQPFAAFHDSRVSRRATLLGAGIAAVALAAVGTWELSKPPSGTASRTIAVLPFANLSGDPAQAYFSDGIADEIRGALARISGLTVIGSTSSEAVRTMDARTAARKLGVANILTGNVRRSPSTIRISAELIDGATGADRWTQNYDRSPDDAIKIQTDIATNVASALQGALGLAGRTALGLGGTPDGLAQDLLLQSKNLARESTSVGSVRRRLALTESAIARDPNYADAYVEKANLLFDVAINYSPSPGQAADQLAQSGAAARRAIALAPGLGSAHDALASIAIGRLDFRDALQQTRKALALSPQDPDVLASGSVNLALFDNAEQGLRIADRAIALDPLNGRFYYAKSWELTFSRRYSQAIDAGRKALQLAPDLSKTHIWVGDALLLLGQPAAAKAEYRAIPAENPLRLERLALLAARAGDHPEAKRMMAQLKQQVGATASYQYGEIYVQLGEPDHAFAEFGNAIAAKDSGLAYLKVDPFLDPVRNDARYTALLRKLNFP